MILLFAADERSGAASRSNLQLEPARRQKTSASARSVSSKKQSPPERQPSSASPKNRLQSSSSGKAPASAVDEDAKRGAESSIAPQETEDLCMEAREESAGTAGLNGRQHLPEAEQTVTEPSEDQEADQQASVIIPEEAEQQQGGVLNEKASAEIQEEAVPSTQGLEFSAASGDVAGSMEAADATVAAEDPAVAATQLAEDSRRCIMKANQHFLQACGPVPKLQMSTITYKFLYKYQAVSSDETIAERALKQQVLVRLINILHRSAERWEEEEAVLAKAKKIKKRRDPRVLAHFPEPKKIKVHWDFLLEEMQWMAKEFARQAQTLIYMCDSIPARENLTIWGSNNHLHIIRLHKKE